MAQLDTLDLAVLLALLLATIAYFTKGTYWAKPLPLNVISSTSGAPGTGRTRDILKRMNESNKNCIIFYGSQTGTAEDYAQRLSKEAHSRFGLSAMTADLEDFDYESLDTLTDDKVAMFVLATYGEGEPTDNAVDFFEYVGDDNVTFSQGMSADQQPLVSLNYVAFGLGNNTYEHYNAVVRKLVKIFDNLGAHRIGQAGEGDDGAGTMEEDFLAWKEPMWTALAKKMNLQEREAVYEAVYEIRERPDMDALADSIYLGEPNKSHLHGLQKGPYNAQNPYIAPIVKSKELFTDAKRNCLHMEFDISATNLSYTTGDHLAVWPTNPGREVDRFLDVLGLTPKRDTVIEVRAIDSTSKVPFPSPTTYETAIRYHLEICAPISRQFVSTLSEFAPNAAVKAETTRIGKDKDYFANEIAHKNYNIAQLLQHLGQGACWSNVPFSIFIEGIHKIQPRYYSISSSSQVHKQQISITAVVESREVSGAPNIIKGVTTNYLLALKQKQHGDPDPDPNGLQYAISGPRNKYDGFHVPVHIRHSNFKLPSNPTRPIIMIGPGTGVAPFRAFVQERAQQASGGEEIGQTVLFYGCRNRNEDYLYKDEWRVGAAVTSTIELTVQRYQEAMGEKFDMQIAFSREGPKKVYVQHLLRDKAAEINELLLKKAYIYICGDAANMAREVQSALADIIAQQRGVPSEKAESIIKSMRTNNTYQEDVWS